jgi:hypothetical protein
MFGNLFSNLKNKALSMMLEKQLKNLPPEQQKAIMTAVQNNPKLFEDIAKEIEEEKKKGVNELYAGMAVMKKYQSQLQAAMGGVTVVRKTVEK